MNEVGDHSGASWSLDLKHHLTPLENDLNPKSQGSLNFDDAIKMCMQYPETPLPFAPLPLSSMPYPNRKNPLKDLALEGCISQRYFLSRQVSAIQNK